MIKVVIGIVIIILSFAFIMKNHDKSLMDKLMEKRRTSQDQGNQETSEQDPPTQH